MKIRNLYIKLFGKVIEGTKEQIDFNIQDLKIREITKRASDALKEMGIEDKDEITEEHKAKLDFDAIQKFTEEEEANFKAKGTELARKTTYRLKSIKDINVLYKFILANWNNITTLNQAIFLNKEKFDNLLQASKITQCETLEIWLDSDKKFCTIFSITKEQLDKSLADNVIDTARYEELLKIFE